MVLLGYNSTFLSVNYEKYICEYGSDLRGNERYLSVVKIRSEKNLGLCGISTWYQINS